MSLALPKNFKLNSPFEMHTLCSNQICQIANCISSSCFIKKKKNIYIYIYIFENELDHRVIVILIPSKVR